MIKEIGGKEVKEVKTGDNITKIVNEGPDMDELRNEFASKLPPENTIKRIEALEKIVNDLKKQEGFDPSLLSKFADKDALESLKKRVEALEKDADETKVRVKNNEVEIDALKRMLAAMGNIEKSSGGGMNIDTTQILMKISML